MRGITRRYIRLEFNRSLKENELIDIAECAIKQGEGISRIKRDTDKSTVIDFTFHKN